MKIDDTHHFDIALKIWKLGTVGFPLFSRKHFFSAKHYIELGGDGYVGEHLVSRKLQLIFFRVCGVRFSGFMPQLIAGIKHVHSVDAQRRRIGVDDAPDARVPFVDFPEDDLSLCN